MSGTTTNRRRPHRRLELKTVSADERPDSSRMPRKRELSKLDAALRRLNLTDQQLTELYESGLTVAQIAARLGEVAPGSVWTRLTRLNVRMRSQGAPLSAPDIDPVLLGDLYERQQLAHPQIAKRLNLPRRFVYYQLLKHNIGRRNRQAADRVRREAAPSFDELERLYLIEKLSKAEIARRYGKSAGTVATWLRLRGITRAPGSTGGADAAQVKAAAAAKQAAKKSAASSSFTGAAAHHSAPAALNGAGKPGQLDAVATASELTLLYNSGLTTREIGERCNVSSDTVRRRLSAAGVTLRPGGTKLKVRVAPPDLLHDLYERQKLGIEAIAAKLKTSGHFVKAQLSKHGIRLRTHAEANRARAKIVKPSEQELRRLYLVEKKSQTEIARQHNTFHPQVSVWLASYNIRKPLKSVAAKAEKSDEPKLKASATD